VFLAQTQDPPDELIVPAAGPVLGPRCLRPEHRNVGSCNTCQRCPLQHVQAHLEHLSWGGGLTPIKQLQLLPELAVAAFGGIPGRGEATEGSLGVTMLAQVVTLNSEVQVTDPNDQSTACR
jgi:hypothetical protein